MLTPVSCAGTGRAPGNPGKTTLDRPLWTSLRSGEFEYSRYYAGNVVAYQVYFLRGRTTQSGPSRYAESPRSGIRAEQEGRPMQMRSRRPCFSLSFYTLDIFHLAFCDLQAMHPFHLFSGSRGKPAAGRGAREGKGWQKSGQARRSCAPRLNFGRRSSRSSFECGLSLDHAQALVSPAPALAITM